MDFDPNATRTAVLAAIADRRPRDARHALGAIDGHVLRGGSPPIPYTRAEWWDVSAGLARRIDACKGARVP